MKKLLFIFSAVVVVIFLFSCFFRGKIQPANTNIKTISSNQNFELQEGDILVRPNWSWLPGSCFVESGRKYGHVAIVTKGASGATINEALEKAWVAEALFFDQATKEFQFKKENQIREGKAIVSFGEKFRGIRYRLRMPLTEEQKQQIVRFSREQLGGGYNILSVKRKNSKNEKMENLDWHCATLAWQAYYLAAHTDIDANGGWLIYPSDIIASPVFNRPDGIVRF
jgi:hypothetical protein